MAVLGVLGLTLPSAAVTDSNGPEDQASPRASDHRRRSDAAGGDAWPRIRIEDVYTRDAATRAMNGASEWLKRPDCQAIFTEFQDGRGLPLTVKLRELEADAQSYLRMLYFLDGELHAPCKKDGVLAFTGRGSRVIYLCGRYFERRWRQNAAETQATILHEVLHSLGLGEYPPTPRYITHRVQRRCS